jgi:hypothetical protein
LKITNPLIHSINGKEVLTWPIDHKNEKAFIVTTDLNLPVIDGLEFLKKDNGQTAITLETVDNRIIYQIGNSHNQMVTYGNGNTEDAQIKA